MARPLFLFCTAGLALPAYSQTLPPVNSATLVAQFQAEPGSVVTDAQGVVQSWTALNDPSLVLTSMGSPGPQIVFQPTAMNGAGALVFSDPGTAPNTWLEGMLPAAVSLEGATVFWLGHYTTDTATYGRYCYSIGTSSGSGSTQLTHQSDDDVAGGYRIEIYSGDLTFTGSSISDLENDYVVWRTEYYTQNPPINHIAYADGQDLNVSSSPVGYDVSPDPHPIFISGFETDGFNFVGRMAEFLIYDGILDAAEVSAVEAYLQAREGVPIYTNFCASLATSQGVPSVIHAGGSTSLASNDLVLSAQPVPPNAVGIFYYGSNEIQVPFGNGIRCIGGSTFRIQPPAPATSYTLFRAVDNTALPNGGDFVAGGTYKFQAWFRDPGAGGSGFNLSDGLSITFGP